MAVSRINEAGLNVNQYGNRNLIINGAMQVAQRGTSFTGSGEYTLDRFYQQESGGTATTTQETFALGSELEGFTKYLKMVVSTGNDYCGILHKVEDVKSLPQGKATFSFYAKGTNPSTGSLEVKIIRMHDGSTVHDTILNTTATLTSSWQRFTNTFDVGSLSGMSTPNANSLLYIAIRQSGSDTGTAAWELNLTGVQLEVGDTATDFEHRTYEDEYKKCLRYYERDYSQKEIISLMAAYSTDAAYGEYKYYVRKRATPTITFQTASNYRLRIGGNNRTCNAIGSSAVNNENFRLDVNVGSNQTTTGHAGWLGRVTGDTFIEIDAEL